MFLTRQKKAKSRLYQLPLTDIYVDPHAITRVGTLDDEKNGPRVVVHLGNNDLYIIRCDNIETAKKVAREVAEKV